MFPLIPPRSPLVGSQPTTPQRPAGRRLLISVTLTVLGTGAVIALVAANAGDVGDALSLATFEQIATLVVLHLVALLLRAEAWGLCLAAGDAPVPRRHNHSASSLRFLADTTVPTYLGAWVRIAILKRLDKEKAPSVGQMITADGTLLIVEALITVVLLVTCSLIAGLSWYWPTLFLLGTAAAFGGVVILRRRFANRDFVRAFDVLAHARHRVTLTLLLIVVLTIQPVRFYVALHAVGLDATAIESLLTFVTTSVINILPVGPGPASVGAAVSVFGDDGLGAATASGLVLAATGFVAAGLYSMWGAVDLLRDRREAARRERDLEPDAEALS